VIFVADSSYDTLQAFNHRKHIAAEKGQPGQGSNKTGHGGDDITVPVPVGTILYDDKTNLALRDLSTEGERVTVARGGKGGRGNKRFATSINRSPRETEDGAPGEERRLRLELKLLADVGLVGLPNAGKSTFVSRVSHARPRIANYPFTTRYPSLGIVDVGNYKRLVVADIPGLIEGAHDGHGLGIEFLRHIERTRVLLHLLDAAATDGVSPLDAYHTLRDELSQYGHALKDRPHVVAANKIDVPEAQEALDELREALDVPVFPISAVTGEGVDELLRELVRIVDALNEQE